jgi:hypothetical protein
LLDQATGTFTWNPPIFQPPGVYDFTMSASGPLHKTAKRSFTIRVLSAAGPRRDSR